MSAQHEQAPQPFIMTENLRMHLNSQSIDSATLPEKLDRFFSLFEPTITLAENLINARANPQEVVLMLCARLDALASCNAREDQPNRQSFIRLLTDYSGHRDLMESVSVGDLYYELGYHRWLSEGLVPKPGRLTRFSRVNDPIIHLLDRSGIPLTCEAVQKLLTRLMSAISQDFRCRPGQPRWKPVMEKPKSITRNLIARFKGPKDEELRQNLGPAIEPLLQRKTLAAILYENFRNAAIHGLKVPFNEIPFFRAREPYWESLYADYYPPFLFVKFPGRFLVEVLRNCIEH